MHCRLQGAKNSSFPDWTRNQSGWKIPLMATKPKDGTDRTKEMKSPVPGPVGDGFPREKDVSTPPPGSDQAKKDKPRK